MATPRLDPLAWIDQVWQAGFELTYKNSFTTNGGRDHQLVIGTAPSSPETPQQVLQRLAGHPPSFLRSWTYEELQRVNFLLKLVPARGPVDIPDYQTGRDAYVHKVSPRFFEAVVDFLRLQNTGASQRKMLHRAFNEKIQDAIREDPAIQHLGQEIAAVEETREITISRAESQIETATRRAAQDIYNLTIQKEKLINQKLADLEPQRDRFLYITDPDALESREL